MSTEQMHWPAGVLKLILEFAVDCCWFESPNDAKNLLSCSDTEIGWRKIVQNRGIVFATKVFTTGIHRLAVKMQLKRGLGCGSMFVLPITPDISPVCSEVVYYDPATRGSLFEFVGLKERILCQVDGYQDEAIGHYGLKSYVRSYSYDPPPFQVIPDVLEPERGLICEIDVERRTVRWRYYLKQGWSETIQIDKNAAVKEKWQGIQIALVVDWQFWSCQRVWDCQDPPGLM
jgi:hypothetical protein